jgi:hypothetical protein
VVADVVTEIGHRRAIDRREPNRINAQAGDVVQSRTDAGEISNAVAVGVRKRARIDLIDDRRPPPRHLSIALTIHRASPDTDTRSILGAELTFSRRSLPDWTSGSSRRVLRGSPDDRPREKPETIIAEASDSRLRDMR